MTKKIKEWFMALAGLSYVKYIVVLVVGIALIGFIGSSSLWAHFNNKQRISELQEEIEYYDGEYRRDQSEIRRLESDKKAIERIARERYFMKMDDEDIFILSDDSRQPLKHDPAHETIE